MENLKRPFESGDSSTSNFDSNFHYDSDSDVSSTVPVEKMKIERENVTDDVKNIATGFSAGLAKAAESDNDDSSDYDSDSYDSSKVSVSKVVTNVRSNDAYDSDSDSDFETGSDSDIESSSDSDIESDSDVESDSDLDNDGLQKDSDSEHSSKTRNRRGRKESESKKNQKSKNISKARDNQRSKKSESDIDDSFNIMKSIYRKEKSRSKKSESDIDDSFNLMKSIYRKEKSKPKIDGSLGDSYESFLASISNDLQMSDSGIYTNSTSLSDLSISARRDPSSLTDKLRAEIQQPTSTRARPSDQSNNQYKSRNKDEEERILFLHEEMKKIGLSPTIVVYGDDATYKSGRSSIGGDSYLEDLLQQREDREELHREEIMEEALECYKEIREPKSELLFLEILEQITKQKKEEHAKEDLVQDKRIAKELMLQAEPLKSKSFSKSDSKEQQQNDTKKVPPSGPSLFAAIPKPDEQEITPVRKRKTKGKGSKSLKNSLQDEGSLKRTNEQEPIRADLEGNNDVIEYGREKNNALESSLKRTNEQEPIRADVEENNDVIEYGREKSNVGESSLKRTNEQEPIRADLEENNDVIEYGREKNNAATPVAIPEESPSSSSSPSSPSYSASTSSSSLSSDGSNSQLSFNAFDDEYYYDEERASMDREKLRVLEQEAELSRRESRLTRKMMLASSFMCCLAFCLLLFFILDPLDRGSVFDKK